LTLDLIEIARAIGTNPPETAATVLDYSIDTRSITPGALFFALRGQRDGHEFVTEAFQKGAAAAVVDREVPASGPLLRVRDTSKALEQLAASVRGRLSTDVIAVTGSAGKTTTKEVVARLLASELKTGKSEANLNNHLGLPLSLLRMPLDTRAAVVEMGMNHAGEIRHLCSIARPQVGVVTNVGYAHIENFDSIEDIALAKRELVESLPADGVAVLNADDERVLRFREIHPGQSITYGIRENAVVQAEDVEYSPGGIRFRASQMIFESLLAGRHGVLNILAGLAVARIYGIAPHRLAGAVRELTPQRMRGERTVHRGIVILDDCYNSNPDAACAMVDVLMAEPAERRIAVLGEMLELGRWSETLHRSVGNYAFEAGVSVLIGIRGAARLAILEAVAKGLPASAAYFFDEPAQAGEFLRQFAHPGDAILFKGSRGTRVEAALNRFLALAQSDAALSGSA
jgi:UDP-N-acetylmuramoyl-tripeptide--D-alanyl-D-alanine ligase